MDVTVASWDRCLSQRSFDLEPDGVDVMVFLFKQLVAALTGERVTATFLVTAKDPCRIRADLYRAGADFDDSRVAFFDWSFTVRARRRSWEDFLAGCREPLLQLQVSPAY